MQALSLSTEIIRTYKASSLLRPLKALTKEVFSPKSSLYIYRYLLKKKKNITFSVKWIFVGILTKLFIRKEKKLLHAAHENRIWKTLTEEWNLFLAQISLMRSTQTFSTYQTLFRNTWSQLERGKKKKWSQKSHRPCTGTRRGQREGPTVVTAKRFWIGRWGTVMIGMFFLPDKASKVLPQNPER